MPEFQPADESDAATTPAAGDALFALALEATETRQRARLGGWFYLGGWVLVCVAAGFGGAVAWAVGAAMAALAVARYLLPAAGDDTLDGLQRALHWSWAVALSSAALWGVVAVVVATDARFEAARPIALFATVAYATAFAHSFPMRRGSVAAGDRADLPAQHGGVRQHRPHRARHRNGGLPPVRGAGAAAQPPRVPRAPSRSTRNCATSATATNCRAGATA